MSKLRVFLIPICLFFITSLASKSSAAPSQEALEKWPILTQAAEQQEKKHFKSALKLYRYAYENHMNPPAAAQGIAESYEGLEKPHKATQFLQETVNEHPFDLELRLLFAEKLNQYGNSEKALKEFEVAEQFAPKDLRATYKKAQIFKEQGKHDQAIHGFSLFINQTKPTNFEPYLERAQSYLHLSNLPLAEKDVRKAYEIKALHVGVLVTYAHTLKALKMLPNAESMAKQCTDLASDSASCWEMRGDVASDLKKSLQAREFYQAAVKYRPEDHFLRAKLANAHLSNSEFGQADVEFSRTLKTKPDDLEALKVWLPSLISRQEFALATETLDRYQKQNPKELWSAVQFAKLLQFSGAKERAVDVLKTTMKALRSDVSRIYFAHALYENGQYSKAEDVLEDITNPSLPGVYNLGVVYWKMKKPEKAAQTWQKISVESPYTIPAQINLTKISERSPTSQDLNEVDMNQQFAWEHPNL